MFVVFLFYVVLKLLRTTLSVFLNYIQYHRYDNYTPVYFLLTVDCLDIIIRLQKVNTSN